MPRKTFYILLFLSIFCVTSHAQKKVSFVFSQLNESNGLPNNSIFCSLQDRDGFIWIGTGDGLIRYDGNHFNVFKSNYKIRNSLPHNIVIDIFEDTEGKIWMATGYGIGYFDKKKFEFVNFSEDTEGKFGRCNTITGDNQDNIWFSGENFVASYSKKTKVFTRYNPNPNIPGSISSFEAYFNSIAFDPVNNGIWLSTLKGINYYDIKTKQFFNYKNNPQKLSIFDDDWKGPINIQGNKMYYHDNITHSLIVFNIQTRKIEKSITCEAWQKVKHQTIFGFLIDRSKNIWLSFGSGSYFIDAPGVPKEIEYQANNKTSVSEKFFSAIWQTIDGTIWIGTTANGISYINPDRIFYKAYIIPYIYTLTTVKKEFESINAFAESEDGTWWIGTWAKKLIHFDPQKKTTEIYTIPNTRVSTRHKYIHTVCDSKDVVYVAIQEGIHLFNKKTKKISPLTLPPKLDLKSMFILSIELQGDFLWVRTDTSSVFTYQISKKEWCEYYIPNNLQRNFYTTRMFLGKDKKGDIWVNLYPKGFAKFSKEKQQFVIENIKDHHPFEEWFFQYQKDSLNNFWIPTLGFGLVKYDTRIKQYSNWRQADGLMSDNCQAACPDGFGKIWISNFNKFSIFNPKDNQFQNFRLPYNEGDLDYRNYMFPLRNKHIMAIQKNYLIEFMPEKVAGEIPKNPALISSLQTPDSTFLVNSEVQKIGLNATQNNFSISYSVLTPYQEQYKYYYMLEGYDENWVAADSKTTANYTKIPGGEYVFKVKTVVNNKSIEGKSLIIEVDTFFYKTRWFLYFILFLIGSLAYAFYRYNVQKTAELHHLQIQTARLQKDKTEIQYQNLINHLNPHFLFNSLTSLNSLIAINPKQASKFLKRLSLIYRYILQNKEKELVSLEEEIAFVQNYIDLQKSRFEEGLQVHIEVPNDYQLYRIVPVTLQNLLENAIKHNVIEDESPLIISIYVQDNYLIMENNLQRKHYVETSNKQGLASLQTLYHYLSKRKLEITETAVKFIVRIPLL